MNVLAIEKIAGMKCVVQGDHELDVQGVYTSDLLSDVMAHAIEGQVFVTIQGHQNSVAVAKLVGLVAIILCNGREPDKGMKEAAHKERLAIYSSGKTQYEVGLQLAQALGHATVLT